jgi:threonylcarbamoyladenosine tRNA methylthiotransferase MtaB
MPEVALAFIGCKLNRYEIQAMSESLERGGFEIVPFNQKADCYIINTCSVTGGAEVTSRQLIRRARRNSPNSKVVVTGCYAQLKPDEIRRIGVDLVVTNPEKEGLPSKIARLFGKSFDSGREEESNQFGSSVISSMGDLTRGFVKIQEGCDRKCTYCTIWMTRGPVRSRRPEYIIAEIDRLYENGYKEIVLTGVHIGKYSYDGLNLTKVLEKIIKETDIPRIRLSSLHPEEVDQKLIELMSSDSRICPHVHLSIQSGDDDILRAMGRGYSRDDVFDTVIELKTSIPGITVGADMIVGFPGETDRNFKNSFALVKEAGIHHLHVFPFSSRPGSTAAQMPAQIDAAIKKVRLSRLKRLGNRIKNRHLKNFIGRELQVLFERRNGKGNGELTGLSQNYLRVNARGSPAYQGRVVRVRPQVDDKDSLQAEVVE